MTSTTMLEQALRDLAAATTALQWHTAVLSYALIVLTIATFVGFFWIGRELKQVTHLIAEVLRRTPAPEGGDKA